ncbi:MULTISPECIES: hypothetical protein [Pseudomonas]|uniref:Secreted protein n=1 Tax=Pseudomonas knackmussii TaxID=65741 RepID=A0ABY4KSS7_9PSED|nr:MULTISPECIES: hypothetical protein [Pseudomonas]UPQ83941.1 hypothetical protein M0M42_05915 [Pseudomonas knackmussii]
MNLAQRTAQKALETPYLEASSSPAQAAASAPSGVSGLASNQPVAFVTPDSNTAALSLASVHPVGSTSRAYQSGCKRAGRFRSRTQLRAGPVFEPLNAVFATGAGNPNRVEHQGARSVAPNEQTDTGQRRDATYPQV